MNRMIPLAASLLMAAIPLTSPAQITWFSPRAADESPSFLGILMQDVTAESASELGLKRAHGALCMEVVPDTPAEEAGLLANDVVTRWDGTRVRSARHLKRLVGDTPVGRTIKVGVQRDGDEKQLKVTVGEQDARAGYGTGFPGMGRGREMQLGPWHPPIDNLFQGEISQDPPRLGVAMLPLSDQLGDYFGLDDNQGGALVGSVIGDSPAEEAGLRAGDVIVEIDGEPIRSTDAVRSRIRRAQGEVKLTIIRDGDVKHLEADLGKDEDEELTEEISYPRGAM